MKTSTRFKLGDFGALVPDLLYRAVEAAGFTPTGVHTQLNSYENRVFDIRVEASQNRLPPPHDRVILKAYRPHRWDLHALHDEHEFVEELKVEGIAAVSPLKLFNHHTLHTEEGFHIALFPKIQGRMPDEFLEGDLQSVGRMLARVHMVGSRSEAQSRPYLLPSDVGTEVFETLEKRVPIELWSSYREAIEHVWEELEAALQSVDFLRIHGDCHRGNLIQSNEGFSLVDFDDFLNGPAVQDFWMLSQGLEEQQGMEQIIEGYEELRSFNWEELELVPLLQAFRIIRYAAWIGQRWNDPFFPKIFPQYTSYPYWTEELRILNTILNT